MRTNFNFNTIMVHGGLFHADDVLCVAMARTIKPSIKIERVFKVPENITDDCIVCDIGGGRYDHHQADAEIRETGYKYAACGLFFRDFWKDLFPTEKSAEKFLWDFIIPIEQTDNGEAPKNPLSKFISSFNPTWNDSADADTAFMEAVSVMETLVKKQIKSANAEKSAEDGVREAYERCHESGVVILPQFMPWQNVICQTDDVKFVIYPSNRGGYNLQAVPIELGRRGLRIQIPTDLPEIYPGECTFVHQAGFLASFESAECALYAARKLIKEESEEDSSLMAS